LDADGGNGLLFGTQTAKSCYFPGNGYIPKMYYTFNGLCDDKRPNVFKFQPGILDAGMVMGMLLQPTAESCTFPLERIIPKW